MKQIIFASTLGFALIASTAWMPSQKVGAVSFSSPEDNSSVKGGVGGASRTMFESGTSTKGRAAGSSRTMFESGTSTKTGVGGASRTIFESGTSTKTGVGGASRTIFESGTSTKTGVGGASRTIFESGTSTKGRAAGASRNLFTSGDIESPNRYSSGASGASYRDGRRYLNYPDTTVEQPAAILALLPQTYYGKTVSQRAEILVYVPQSAARDSVFSFKDSEGNTVYEMNVPISGKAEIISIKVPVELQVDKEYKWFLALKIDGVLSTRTPYVDGWIKRIQPNQEIIASMQQGDLLQQAETFAKQGVWYDCVTTLAKLRASQPNNVNLDKEWSELLESVGLQQIKKAPIVANNLKF